jgi:hypothetical protein
MFSLMKFQLSSQNLIQKSIHHLNLDSSACTKLFAHAPVKSMMQGIRDVTPIYATAQSTYPAKTAPNFAEGSSPNSLGK